MAFTSTTVCLLAGSVASRTFAGSTYRVGTSPAHGSVDVAFDGMFTYSRTATTDRWTDDPASFGSDEFSVVVRADGRDLADRGAATPVDERQDAHHLGARHGRRWGRRRL